MKAIFDFFHRQNFVSRPKFGNFLSFFTGIYFSVFVPEIRFFFQKPQSENQKCNFLEISRETILFNGHYLKVFWFFSRFFFRDKKKHCTGVNLFVVEIPPPFNIRGVEPPPNFCRFWAYIPGSFFKSSIHYLCTVKV